MSKAGQIVILVLAVLAAVIVTARFYQSGPQQAAAETAKTTAPSAPAPRPVVTEHTKALHDGMVTVPAGKHWSMEFTVDDKARDPRLVGRFEATGGTRKNVAAYLFLPDDYTNWTNRNRARAVYESGEVTVATVDSPLQAGKKYVFVIDSPAWFLERYVSLKLAQHHTTVEYR